MFTEAKGIVSGVLIAKIGPWLFSLFLFNSVGPYVGIIIKCIFCPLICLHERPSDWFFPKSETSLKTICLKRPEWRWPAGRDLFMARGQTSRWEQQLTSWWSIFWRGGLWVPLTAPCEKITQYGQQGLKGIVHPSCCSKPTQHSFIWKRRRRMKVILVWIRVFIINWNDPS